MYRDKLFPGWAAAQLNPKSTCFLGPFEFMHKTSLIVLYKNSRATLSGEGEGLEGREFCPGNYFLHFESCMHLKDENKPINILSLQFLTPERNEQLSLV